MITEPIAVTLLVVEVFDRLGIPYLIGGSLASALHGVVRTTIVKFVWPLSCEF